MKPFAVLIFEINCYETEPVVKIQWGKGFAWGHKNPTDPQASLWLLISTDIAAQTHIFGDLGQSYTKLCGPVSWAQADETLLALKTSFDALNLEHFELTCSDD